jgi:hypothetical protein
MYSNPCVRLVFLVLVLLSITACEQLQPVIDEVKPAIEDAMQKDDSSTSKGSGSTTSTSSSSQSSAAVSPSTRQIIAAIKQALGQGVDDAIYLLGSLQGFNLGQKYHIPLPDKLEKPAELMNKLGQGDKVEKFEERLNQAAKQAVKQATPIFKSAIEGMSVEDALGIIKGQDNAATQYFRTNTESGLREQFLPIIEQVTDQTGLTRTYKSFNNTVSSISPSLSGYTVDIDDYVLGKSMDALFDRIAIEEKLIREDPVNRTTDLLEQVFGYFE